MTRRLCHFCEYRTLGIDPKDIGGCKLGCLGIPEFGTDFAMQMLVWIPSRNIFSDLVPWTFPRYGCMAGKCADPDRRGKGYYFHGNLYSEMILMIYLIGQGVESGLALLLWRASRKGKGLGMSGSPL